MTKQVITRSSRSDQNLIQNCHPAIYGNAYLYKGDAASQWNSNFRSVKTP